MMEEQTTSPRQEDLKSKQKLTLQNRILNLGKATEIYSRKGTASLEEFAPVMEALTPVSYTHLTLQTILLV